MGKNKNWKLGTEIEKKSEKSFCHKLQFRRPLIFQTMNAVRSYDVSLKYQRSTSTGCKIVDYKNWICEKGSIPFTNYTGPTLF